jgi:phosphate uptake regulator
MERRKIQKIGYSTLCVSLPKEWIAERGVTRGEFVFLSHEKDGSLRVLTENLIDEQNQPLQFNINLELFHSPKIVERLIVGCYMMGAEIITIASSSRIESSKIEEVRMVVSRTIGLSIIEETKTRIVLNCSIDPSKFTIHQLLRRQSAITSTMLDESIEAFLTVNTELAKDVIKRENEANAIYRLITRLLFTAQTSLEFANAMGITSFIEVPNCWSCSWALERIGDCAEQIAKLTLDFKNSDEKAIDLQQEQLTTLSRNTIEIYAKSMKSFFDENLIDANETIDNRYNMENEIAAFLREKDIVPFYRVIATYFDVIIHNIHVISATTIHNEAKKLQKIKPNSVSQEQNHE